MKGHMFYHVASRLYAELSDLSPGEGFVRTIISRAYYAVLLVLREAANLDTSGRGGHQRVLNYYRRMEGVGMVIGDQFQYLMDLRIEADYEMDARLTVDDAKVSLNLCRDILESVSMAPGEIES